MAKVNKYIVQIMLICTLIFNFNFTVMAAEGDSFVSEDSNFRYTVLTEASSSKNGTVSVKANTYTLTSAEIQAVVQDGNGNKYNVTEIAKEGFEDCSSLRKITLPDTVEYIGIRAFSGCTRLNKMIIQSEEIQIGRNAFEDIEENIEFYVSSKSVRSELEDYGIDEALIILGDENDEENDEFRLKIIAGDGGTVSGSGYYKYGEKVTIKAYPKDGYEFESWEIISGKPKIANDTEKKTTLKMPDDSVKVKANFTYVGTEGLPSQSDIDEFDKIYVTNLYGNNLMGENVSLNISDDGRISTGKFSKVIGTQAKLTVSAQDYKWTVNGSDIRTDIKDKAYCNFKVDFFKPNNWEIGYLTEYKNIIQFKLAEDTELPFEGTLEFNLDLNEDFTRVYLYKYDEQAQKITYSGFSDVAKKEFNTVKFKISYGGEYVVTSQIIKNSFVNMTFENNKNINSIVPYYLENNIPRPIIQSAAVGDTLSFKADKTAFYGYIDNYQGFLDIEDSWAKEAIEFVSARRIVNGSTQTLFEPEIILTKADFLEGLARVDGQSQNAVLWARSNGIVSETSDFRAAMTRQEMAAIFYRYCIYKGIELPQTEPKTGYIDDKDIPQWSRNYIAAMSSKGIVVGKKNGKFEPYSYATKAEASISFKRLIEIMVLENN